MRPKRRRLYFVLAGMAALGIGAFFLTKALENNFVFFRSPTDVITSDLPKDQKFRLGGLVENGSLQKLDDGVTLVFRITDLSHSVAVTYSGFRPDLFDEGKGVVAEGYLRPDGVFVADVILAKHDENYMPPEVAEALKKSGQWKDAAQ